MKNEIKFLAITAICLAIIPSSVLALGEVAGPIIIYVPVGGTNIGQWGIFNKDSMSVKISVQGDAAKYLSFSSTVDLPGNNQMVYIPITVNIPSDAALTEGTNVTGELYALAEGEPGQVQINVQMEKNIFIIIGNPPEGVSQVQNSPQVSSQSQTQSTVQVTSNPLTAFVSYLPQLDYSLIVAVILGIVIFLAFVFISSRFEISVKKKKGGE
jgi:hypothetical protein